MRRQRRLLHLYAILISALPVLVVNSCAAEYSQLWGEAGEKWSPTSRLPDFSHAGYQRGESALPSVKRGVSVKAFGAKGDGVTDDTRAFQLALEKTKEGAIEVPAGRYRITDFLEIKRSSLLLRGEGPDKSVLYFPKPLNEIKPNWSATTTGLRTSGYSWSGGFVTLRGNFQSAVLAKITGGAGRGAQKIEVSSATRLKAGQEVEIYQTDNQENSLAIHLYSEDAGPVKNLKGRARMSLVTRIMRIDGNTVEFDRPLRCDLRQEWSPVVRAFVPTVTGSGIEGLEFEFPETPYKGHFSEVGFNPLALSGVAHCWVRDIRIRNADSGPYVSGFFNTIDQIVIESGRTEDKQKCTGHHGISITGGENLIARFDIRTRFIHDITVSGYCAGNVMADGRGLDLSLDHHRYAPNENLFTNIDAGEGKRLWKCGGGADLGKHCGARGTFWNIRSAAPLAYPPEGFGPVSMNLVGLETDAPTEISLEGKWFEAIPPGQLLPENLHRAQLARRLHQIGKSK